MIKIPNFILLIVVIVGAYIFINKLYYPPLPIDTISKIEVLDRGLIFEKQSKKLIVTTKKWTGNYSLVDIPTHYK